MQFTFKMKRWKEEKELSIILLLNLSYPAELQFKYLEFVLLYSRIRFIAMYIYTHTDFALVYNDENINTEGGIEL